MQRYVVLESCDQRDFQGKVEQFLNANWYLYGDPIILFEGKNEHNGYPEYHYYQAVVKQE